MKNSEIILSKDVTIMIVSFFDPYELKINRKHNIVCGMIILMDDKI